MERDREAIESDFGEPLSWQELPGKKSSRIAVYNESADPTDEADWPNQYKWMAERLERLDRVFRQRVKSLDASDWSDPEVTEEETSE